MESKKLSVEGLISPSYVDEIVRLHNINPFAVLLGIKIDGLAKGYCRLLLSAEEKCTNPYGGLHGGVFATLADISMGIALRTVGLQPVTAELTVNYLGQTGAGEILITEGRVIHRGNTLILTESTVKSSDGRILAMAKGVFMSRGPLLNVEE
jgi:acyl-CoA thioesterase